MEQANTPERHIPRDLEYATPEQIALKALVDRIDARVFAFKKKVTEESDNA